MTETALSSEPSASSQKDPTKAAQDLAHLRKIQVGGIGISEGCSHLYRSYRRPFLAYFQRNSMDAGQAEDLLQEVFINVVRRAESFKGDSLVSTWLWTIARNKLIDFTRSQKPEVTLDDEGWSAVQEQVVAPEGPANGHHHIDECVSNAFQQFAKQAPDRAEALRRLTLEDWSIEQVAQFIGRTPGATREYLSQCRKKFKAFLEPCREFMNA